MNSAPLISRRRHYFYVLVFSVAVWTNIAAFTGGWFSIYVEGTPCQCGNHKPVHNISLFIFAAIGVVLGLVFSFVLNRISLVANSKPGDRFVPISRWAGDGKKLFGWRGFIILALIPAMYFASDFIAKKFYNPDMFFYTHTSCHISPLHCASIRGDIGAVRKELDKGAIVSEEDVNGFTPLHAAAESGHNKIVKLLIDNGAQVNAKGHNGWTPLHSALVRDHADIAVLLIEKGADVNAKDNDGWTPLHWAAYRDCKAVAELLIAKGAEVDAKDVEGRTVLYFAVAYCKNTVVELLIANGAEVNAKDNDGETPLDWAVGAGKNEVAALLRAHGGKTGEE